MSNVIDASRGGFIFLYIYIIHLICVCMLKKCSIEAKSRNVI